MRWRTDREGLINNEEYLCEIDGRGYEVLLYGRYSCGDEEYLARCEDSVEVEDA